MKIKPTWFSDTNYIADKLVQLKALDYEGATIESVTEAIAGAGGAWNHYELWGYKESYPSNNVVNYLNLKDASGNVVFNTQLYCESKLASLQLSPEYAAVYKTWQDVADMFAAMNLSPYDHFVMSGAAEGLTISSTFNANNYFVAKLQSLIKADPQTYTSWSTAQLAKYFADHNVDPYMNFVTNGAAEGITPAMVAPTGGQGGQTYDLTIGLDNLVGTSGNDMFVAYDFDDQNTLQSGDRIDGGAGDDTLEADLVVEGGSSSNTVTPITNNVEVVKFNARDTTTTGSNFTNARVDAERMHGVEEFWSTKSRGNVSVEDVVSDSNTVTSVFQSSDPSGKTGGVDFSVFFNSQHLKSDAGDVSGKLNLQVIDGFGAAATPPTPLLANVYDTVTFHFNGKQYTLKFAVVNGADATYPKLAAAIQTAIDANAELKAAGVTATVGDNFNFTNRDGNPVVGQNVTLSSSAGSLEAINGSGDGWNTSGAQPPNSNLSAGMVNGTTTGCPLIETSIGLDNVGSIQWDTTKEGCLPDNAIFGSRSGDMVVGGMGARDGVQSFQITADRGSWLNSLSSTNNQLRSITLASEDWNGDGIAGISATKGGQVFIGAHQTTGADVNNTAWQDKGRVLGFGTLTAGKPGADTVGIWDVKEFIASTYTGDINIAAQFSAEAYAKYLSDVDGLKTVYGDYAPSGDFNYTFGTGNDTLNMQVNGGIAADRDFVLNMNMGEGNDFVNYATNFQINNQVVSQAGLFTVAAGSNGAYVGGIKDPNSKTSTANINISTGAGDDIVKTWGAIGVGPATGDTAFGNDQTGTAGFTGRYGAVSVSTGDGKNVVYAAQQLNVTDTGLVPASADDIYNTIWVLNANTTTDTDRGVFFDDVNGAQPSDNNVASTLSTWTSVTGKGAAGATYSVKAVINFMGISAEVVIGNYSVVGNADSYVISATDVNAAIMKTINSHDVLSKLLLVKDGAGQSLLVESLIAGDYSDATEFSITFQDKVSTAATNAPYADLTFTAGGTNYTQVGAWRGGNTATDGEDEHYYGYTDITGGANNDILVTGYADAIVKAAAGNDTIVVGNSTWNHITGGTGADTVVLGFADARTTNNGNNTTTTGGAGNTATYDAVHQAKGDSGTFTTPAASATSVSTANFDVIHHFDQALAANFVSDRLYIGGYDSTLTTPANLTLGSASSVADFATLGNTANDTVNWLRGTYNGATGTFTANNAGFDALVVYDSTVGTVKTLEGVVLTGVATGVTTNSLGVDSTGENFLTFTIA